MKIFAQILLYLIPIIFVLWVLKLLAPEYKSSEIEQNIKYSYHSDIKYQKTPALLDQFVDVTDATLIQHQGDVSYHWFVIQIPKLKDIDHPILVIAPFVINEIKVFKDDELKKPIAIHKRFDFNSDNFASNQNKIIDLIEHKNASHFYIQVKELRNVNIEIQTWELTEFLSQDLRTNSFFSAILFGIFLIIIINIFFYINSKDRAYLYYILYHSFVLILIFNMSGLLNHYPSLSWIAGNYATAIMPLILSSFFFACFVRSFLNTKHLTPKLDKAISVYLVAYPITLLIIILLFNDAIKYYSLVNLIGLSSVPLYLIIMAVHLKLKNRPAIFFTLSFSILLTLTVVRFLYIWDFLPQTFITQFGVIVGVFLETLIFSIGLADRMVQLQRQRDSAELAKAKTDFAYNLEKGFNKLLSKINTHIHQTDEVDHQQYIVDTFFNEFKDSIGIHSNAIIYKTASGIKTIYDSRHKSGYHFDILEANIKQIAFIAKTNEPNKIRGHRSQFMVVPVKVREHEWSACLIELSSEFNDRQAVRNFMQSYAHELIHCLLNAESLSKIKTKAEIDKLTGLYNRGAIEAFIEHELNKPYDANKPLSIAFIDFDDFKLINDQYGHQAGDLCLEYLAKTFREKLPSIAQMGRYGGDEFIVVLPNHSQPIALNLINKIKNKLSVIEHDGKIINFSISIGIATQNNQTKSLNTIFEAADKALYDSKNSGKNNISVA